MLKRRIFAYISIQVLLVSVLSGCVEDNSANFNEAESTLLKFKEAFENSRTKEAKNYLGLDFIKQLGGEYKATDPEKYVKGLGSFIANKKLTRFDNKIYGENVIRLYYRYEDTNGSTGSFWVAFGKEGGSWKIVNLREID